MIDEAKSNNKSQLPILVDDDYSEYNVEGYVQLDPSCLFLNEDGELQTDDIENEEISETNKEYSYYSKHFYNQVF